MGLLAPLALLFGLSLPVIVLLWLLKRRRQEHEVSSTYLWHQVLRDVRANAPWQRLRLHLLLLLQLLIAALLALALARPHLLGAAGGQEHLILLVDVSGSMQTAADVSGGPSRFDLARAEAAAQLQALPGQGRATLVAVGHSPKVLAQAAPRAQVQAALAALKPTYEGADWSQALSLAAAIGREQPGAQALLLTDAPVPPATLAALGFPARAVSLGQPVDNLSVQLSLRTDAGSFPAALARVVNHGRAQAQTQMQLLADGELLDERRVDVPPGGSAEVVWKDLPTGARAFTARLAGPDALAADNAAHAVVNRRGRSQALLVSRSNLFLDQALSLRADMELVRTTPQNYAPGQYQLYIFDGWLPPTLPGGALLLINPPDSPLVSLMPVASAGALHKGLQSGPVLAYVPLDDVHVARARPINVPTWANSLLESPEGTLLAAGHESGRPVAVFGFDIHESDLPLRIGFPVLMQNLLAWLVPPAPTATRVSAGESLPLALDPLATAATVTTPDERVARVAPPLPAAPWTDTALPGVYTLTQTLSGGGERVSAFVVAVPAGESGAGEGIAPAATARQGAGGGRPPLREVWPWLAALALLLLGAEWWVFVRGT